jgi:RimJ/RimL family protein N-acetyltransferase
MALAPFTLAGAHVSLEPLSGEHIAPLAAAARGDRDTYVYTEVPDGEAAMAAYVRKLLAQGATGVAVPFVQRRTADRELVGCTRYMELRWWRGRVEPDEVEIGGTWLAAEAQRTPINTEAKLLLCTHAFEVWEVSRVAWATDVRNERSRVAIERLGARLEGVLRHHRPSTVAGEEGRPRDTALYAMTDDEWPAAKAALLDRLAASVR